jgi:hypothetical protein
VLDYVTVGPSFTRAPGDEPTRSWALDAADEAAATGQAAAVYRSLYPDVGSLRVRATPESERVTRLQPSS